MVISWEALKGSFGKGSLVDGVPVNFLCFDIDLGKHNINAKGAEVSLYPIKG